MTIGGDHYWSTVGTGATNGGATNGGGTDGGATDEEVNYDLSTNVATEAVRIELDANSGKDMVPAGEDLTITLKKFGLPSSIPESSVLILGKSDRRSDEEPYSGEPSEVRIEAGNKVVLVAHFSVCQWRRCRSLACGSGL